MTPYYRPLVLSLFPGIDLLGRAFEQEDFTVVRGPDLLWGGDVRRFHVPAGRFDGVIGGPPCQVHSRSSVLSGTQAVDLIPEFVRLVNEAQPRWLVMENVTSVRGHPSIPADWQVRLLTDWDCGGLTCRQRAFWTWPLSLPEVSRRPGHGEHSVMATSWKRGSSESQYVADKGFLPGDLPVSEYGRLQGASAVADSLMAHRCSKAFAVHVLGNGVPMAMGGFVARNVRDWLEVIDDISVG